MPTPPIPPRPTPTPPPTPASTTVRPGDTLGSLARRLLGDAGRWREIYDLNRGVIGHDPGKLKVGQVLRLPRGAAAPQPTRPAPVPPPRPRLENGRGDRDGDGVQDRYDRSPDNPADRRWNKAATDDYTAYVKQRTLRLSLLGVEIDRADLALKLLSDFCKTTGLPNPIGESAERWQVYEPGRTGGLPNVKGPNYFLPGLGADNLAKNHTKTVNDADGNGIRGWDRRTGQVDVADLRPGDILFYDWEGDGKVNHTINVLEVHPDGAVLLGWGTYDNLAEDGDVKWKNLDLSPIQGALLRPGTEEYEKYLGPGNSLWGVRRYEWTVDKEASPSIAYVPYMPAPEPLPAPAAPPAPAGEPGAAQPAAPTAPSPGAPTTADVPATPPAAQAVTPAVVPAVVPAIVPATPAPAFRITVPARPPVDLPAPPPPTPQAQPGSNRSALQGFVDPVQPTP